MELNREQIIKTLECCASKGGCKKCPLQPKESLAICVTQISKNALALIKELTEENERLHAYCTELAQRLHEASEENISVCLKNFDLIIENERVKTDTVRTMQSMIKEECIKGGIYPVFVHSTINRIAKEIIEETQLTGGD